MSKAKNDMDPNEVKSCSLATKCVMNWVIRNRFLTKETTNQNNGKYHVTERIGTTVGRIDDQTE